LTLKLRVKQKSVRAIKSGVITIFISFLGVVESDYFDHHENAYNDYGTCSIVLNGTAILFGGRQETMQISVVYRTGIKRINTLSFDFKNGKCHFNNGIVFLCFDMDDRKICRERYFYYKTEPLNLVHNTFLGPSFSDFFARNIFIFFSCE